MTDLEFLEEHIEANEVAMSHLMNIIANALPHTQAPILDLLNEWKRVSQQITIEYRNNVSVNASQPGQNEITPRLLGKNRK